MWAFWTKQAPTVNLNPNIDGKTFKEGDYSDKTGIVRHRLGHRDIDIDSI